MFTALAIFVLSAGSSWHVAGDEMLDETGSIIFGPDAVDCQTLNYDCHGCLEHGCYWCPTDALCFSTPEYMDSADRMKYHNKKVLFPDRIHNCKTPESFTQMTCTPPENFFADPAYSAQKWIFDMIKVEPVWARGYTGTGVRVRINDSGMEVDHPEFLGRVDLDASCPVYKPIPNRGNSFHGTVVASLVGATANNDNCGIGIAPGVTFSSCTIDILPVEELFAYKLLDMDISQNSWGTDGCGMGSEEYAFCNGPDCERKLQEKGASSCPFIHKPFESYILFPCDHCEFSVGSPRDMDGWCENSMYNHCLLYPVEENKACMEFYAMLVPHGECHFGTLSQDIIAVLTRGITDGRDGKGIIYVFASGNSFWDGDDTNFQDFTSSRFIISVGAVGKRGIFSHYSTPGASVFVSAPGGDLDESVTSVVAANLNGSCKDGGDGTSYAAPIVSGVVALMLEANPDLGWRDVKYILALTSEAVNQKEDETVATNGAGIVHSDWYGFGIVNAEKAVETSERWINIGPEEMLSREGKGKIHIPDDASKSIEIPLDFHHDSKFITETVYLYLKFEHSSRGHLRIELISPSGMVSVMAPGKRPEAQQWRGMKFTSVRHWGEDPTGTWTIKIVDTTPGNVNDCISYHDYRIDLIMEENFTRRVSCDARDIEFLRLICQGDDDDDYDCNGNDFPVDSDCYVLNQLETKTSGGRNVYEACCECGGGFSPDLLPEELLEWKVVVYGHQKMPGEGIFSGVEGSTELGKWGERGRVYAEGRLRVPP